MRVKWYGHASFLITADDGTKIVTDPCLTGAYNGAIGYGELPDEADIVTVSHDHDDHGHAAGVPGNTQVIKDTGSHTAKGVPIKGIASAHDNSGGSQRGSNVIFCFTVDGIRVCHLGDLGHHPTEEQLSDIGRVDVLLCPVGGMATVDADGATKICDAIKPKVVIPMHFKTEKCGFPFAPLEDFLKDKPNVERVGTSETEFKKNTLPSATEIVVLEYAL